MSKFVYILHRQLLDEGVYQHTIKRIERADSFSKEKRQDYRALFKQIFICQQAPNVKVDTELNLRISLPNETVNGQELLRITDNETVIEVKGDMLGTRIVWHYFDEEKLIISSSQQAIVALIGNYQPNKEAWTWMLSNGSLGPGLSWDSRIHALDPGTTLFFDKKKWEVNLTKNTWKFEYRQTDVSASAAQLEQLLQEVALDFPLGEVPALLTLSGGYDSRAALYLLKKMNPHIHTATWGVPAAFQTVHTDATVARQVSNAWGIRHAEYDVQLKTDFESALNVFLRYGEGRNDHINSFMDGLSMWRSIADQGYKWVIRADEAFGWLPVRTELDARTSVAFAQLSDFNNIPRSLVDSLADQIIPDQLVRHTNEPVEDFRDRLYQQYRLPFVIGPLQDIPLSFLEILNPLLHPKLVSFVRTLPPDMRTKKRLYAEWVDKLLPAIPYATLPAIPEAFHVAEAVENKHLFTEFFTDQSSSHLLGTELMNFLQSNWKAKQEGSARINSSWKRKAGTILPVGLKKFLRNKVTGYKLNTSSLALRAFIIYRMQEIMKAAAK